MPDQVAPLSGPLSPASFESQPQPEPERDPGREPEIAASAEQPHSGGPFIWTPNPGRWPETALSTAKLCAVGFSVVLLLQTLALKPTDRAAFLVRNELGADPRHRLLLSLGAAGG